MSEIMLEIFRLDPATVSFFFFENVIDHKIMGRILIRAFIWWIIRKIIWEVDKVRVIELELL